MNLDNKKFIATENKSGLSSTKTIFHYFQNGSIISGTYGGGAIQKGSLLLENK